MNRLLRAAIATLVLMSAERSDAQAARTVPPPSAAAADSSALAIVREYFAAYNAHDVEGVMRLMSPDVTWLSVTGDSVVVESRGAAPLRTYLTGYFQRLPSARSEMETASVLGPWVTARERASWTAASGLRTQASMSVYEVRDGVIRRVWYYPVER